ncbi:MAG: hypothetical protein LBV74_18495 [Tannerella sp.]|jgi:hypothetical protein|nr:hypothetical protein [Tannerella sp.]
MKKFLIHILSVIFLAVSWGSCIEDSDITPGVRGTGKPEFTTSGITIGEKTASSIEVKAEILTARGAVVEERGFCYGKTEDLSIENCIETIPVGEGIGKFEYVIDGLENHTSYFIRAYARNTMGTEYTPAFEATTNDGSGKVCTIVIDTLIRAAKATVGAKIESMGEGELEDIGVSVSKTFDFAESADEVNINFIRQEDNTYLYELTELKPSTKYYVRAFFNNKIDVDLGLVDSVETLHGKLIFGEIRPEVGYTDVVLESSVTSEDEDETVEILERGFCWSINPEPTIADSVQCGAGFGEFNAVIKGLKAEDKYYVRAYARTNFNAEGEYEYGNSIVSFTTKRDIPTVDIGEATNIQNGNAVIKGLVKHEGASSINTVGMCWSTSNPKPTKADHDTILSQAADGSFSMQLTGLKGGTTYYVRAYAINEQGIGYSDENETTVFTTPSIFKTGLATFPGATRLSNSTAYFAINDNLYLVGGDLGANLTNEMYVYSISKNEWTSRKPFSGGAAKWLSAVGYGNSGFVYGGVDKDGYYIKGFYEYESRGDENEWRDYEGPDSMVMTTVVSKGNSIYYIGGNCDTVKREVWEFQPGSKIWEKKTDFPVAQYGGISVVLDNVIYAGMGKDSYKVCNNSLWTTKDGAVTWDSKIECSISNEGILAGVVCNKRIYVINESYYILEYNPETDIWSRKSQIPSDYRKPFNGMYVVNNKIYIGLGDARSFTVYDPTWDNE